MQFLFATPVTRPLGLGTVSGVNISAIFMDLDAGKVTLVARMIEDGTSGRTHVVTISLSPTEINNYTAAAKTALATALNVTFQ